MECNMNEQAGRTTQLSSGSFPMSGAYGNPPPDGDPGMDIPPHLASAIKEWRECLGAVSHTLGCLLMAAMYDKAIDTASAGVAEIARRIIDQTIKQIELVEHGSSQEGGPNRRGAFT
jgi:hypothetical protein